MKCQISLNASITDSYAVKSDFLLQSVILKKVKFLHRILQFRGYGFDSITRRGEGINQVWCSRQCNQDRDATPRHSLQPQCRLIEYPHTESTEIHEKCRSEKYLAFYSGIEYTDSK